MGIRIHKILGYGLDDVQYDTDNWKLTDPRFRDDGYFASYDCEREEKFTDKGFDEYLATAVAEEKDDQLRSLAFLKKMRDEASLNGTKYTKCANLPYDESITRNIVFDTEFGMPNVMVFSPPYFGNSWQRYDDIIDYYEPSHLDDNGGISTGITLLDRTIYPYETYVDCRTTPPTRMEGVHQSMFIQAIHNEELCGGQFEILAKEMGFASGEEVREMVRPMIPEELVALLKYLKVFKDDKYIYQLKPMLYWYWG